MAEAKRAAESSDPAVHYLLARRETLRLWDAESAATVERHKRAVEDRRVQHDEISGRLRALGYEPEPS